MNDPKTIRTVTRGLVTALLIGMVGMVLLTFADHDIPDALATLTGTAGGALASLLVSTRIAPGADQPASSVGS